MFRFKKGVKIDYNRQGYIYFYSRMYKSLSGEERERIRELCRECGGEYYKALLEFVTTDATATAICMKYYMGKSTLYRCVQKYYENFDM